MKKPPTVFIVDDRSCILNAFESIIRTHGFLVHSYKSAAEFVAELDPNQVGCAVVDPLRATEGSAVLRWLHAADSQLSIVLISGLIDPSVAAANASASASVAIVPRPHEIFALLTMVGDGLAGSLSRQVIRDRSRG